MPLTLTAEPPPLTLHDDGSVRVTGTRFLFDVLISAHTRLGWSAERIAQEFDTLALADVYGALRYYLTHRAEVDDYLARREVEAAALRREVEARQGPQPTREELLARLHSRRGA